MVAPMSGSELDPVEVFRSPRARPFRHRALVLRAMGIQHGELREGSQLVLVVPARDAERARVELALYEAENRGWRRSALEAVHGGAAAGAAVYGTLLVVFHACAANGALGRDWYDAGRADAALIRAGELWRTVTALGLHADLAHLLGNVFFGGLFGALLAQAVGPGVGWSLALASAALGNAANAWISGPEHRSIGASTLSFAALGLLVAFQLTRRERRTVGRFARWTPVLMGFLMLAYLGVSGERTDVMAHFAGFAVGGLAGVLWALIDASPSTRVQAVLGVASVAAVAAAWGLAFAA